MIFVFMSAFGSYRAFEHTESVAFCGTTCHETMKPEFVAFQVSSHARLRCVDCHVGAGAEWYARSKITGAYQLYAVAFNKVPEANYHAGPQYATGPGHVRAMSLARQVLRQSNESLHELCL